MTFILNTRSKICTYLFSSDKLAFIVDIYNDSDCREDGLCRHCEQVLGDKNYVSTTYIVCN